MVKEMVRSGVFGQLAGFWVKFANYSPLIS
jgi:hypothetical protein